MTASMFSSSPSRHHFVGCLLGTAAGDARGLPYEGLSRRRLQALYPRRDTYHLLCGYGLCSDDTEHAFIVGQALLASTTASGEQQRHDKFLRSLAWRLRFWILGLPAGIGMATLRGLGKLWLGFSAQNSGVYSAGNGPAMRAPLLGLWSQSLPELRQMVRASTRLTHTDPQAESAALLVAWTARYAMETQDVTPATYRIALEESGLLADPHIASHWQPLQKSLSAKQTTLAFADSIKCEKGITGYIWHTVPAVLHAFLTHPQDYDVAVSSLIGCGGDTDTTAAILGALIGIRVGEQGIASHWLTHLAEWPRSVNQMRILAQRLEHACQQAEPTPPLPCLPWQAPAILLRNILFIPLVLLHGFRRLLPPY